MQYTVHEFGYEYDCSANERYMRKGRGGFASGGARYFRSGRDAFKAIAMEHPNLDVLLPALSCQSMVLPFAMNGQRVRFYRMNVDLSADCRSIEEKLATVRGNAMFVYMNYFGIQSLKEDALIRLRSQYPDAVLIEDRTHDLLSKRQVGYEPDYTVASIRKWLCLPDGGLLWARRPMAQDRFAFEESFFQKRLDAQKMKRAYLSTGDMDTKAEYRDMFSRAAAILDEDNIPYGISDLSKEIIHRVDFERIAEQRARNAAALLKVLMDSDSIMPLQPKRGLSDLYVPIYVDHRDRVQKRLSERNIYCPVIWPLSKEQQRACGVARDVAAHMLAVPCDQRYSESDMEFVGRNVVDVCSGLHCGFIPCENSGLAGIRG